MNEQKSKFEIVRITHRHICPECGKEVSIIANLERKANGDVVFRHIDCAEKMEKAEVQQ